VTSARLPAGALAPRSSRREGRSRQRAGGARVEGALPPRQVLGGYLDPEGHRREVVARRGLAGSVLVVDRDAATRGDRLLVAHLGADEPDVNASLVCRHYLEGDPSLGTRCRALTPADARRIPFAEELSERSHDPISVAETALADAGGSTYRLVKVATGMSIPELRWQRSAPGLHSGRARAASLREVVGALQAYEPACSISGRTLAAAARSAAVSSTVLRLELARVQESPIVLNRRLREVVLATIAVSELSMSEIAIRCGRVKRDSRGNESGETSWLGRRLGLLPEGGQSTPTPWIHSDVLGLIARSGLGLSPREVEA
jgi:hypothetical protein